MGWGVNPADERAADEAREAIRARIADQPMTPFEKELLAVLGDLRDVLQRLGHPMQILADDGDGTDAGPGAGGDTARRRPPKRTRTDICGQTIYCGEQSGVWHHADGSVACAEYPAPQEVKP